MQILAIPTYLKMYSHFLGDGSDYENVLENRSTAQTKTSR